MDAKKLAAMRRARELSREIPAGYAGRDGFMFVAYGCAVFERENAKGRIEYVATNLMKGKSEIIDRRANRVSDRAVDTLLRELANSRVAGMGRYEVDGGTMLPLSKLREVVYAIFRAILPEYGYAVRSGQIALAEELLEAIAGRRVLLAEAAVGIGKTIVYIIIGVLMKRGHINDTWNGGYFPGMSCVEWQRMPILISTSSIALQKAIIDDYLPTISDILVEQGIIRRPLNYVLRKGKQHHVCESNLRLRLSFEKNPKTAAMLKEIIDDPDSIDFAEIGGLKSHIKNKIRVPFKCPKNCVFFGRCRYRAYRESISNSGFDFQVTNHNLLLADARMRSEEKGSVLPPYQMLVIDEAHKLLPAARSIYSAELAEDAAPEIAGAVREMNFRPRYPCDAAGWKKFRNNALFLAEKLYKQNKLLFGFDELTADCDETLMNIAQIAGLLCQTLKNCPKMFVERSERLRLSLQCDLERTARAAGELADSGSEIRWFERDDDGDAPATLYGLPKNLSERVYNDLWKRGVPALLTSGTLSVNGDFDALKHSLGLDKHTRIVETTHSSPYNYRGNCLLYLSENVPYYEKSGYIDVLTDETERLIRASHGRAAVLFTSYNAMGVVHAKLKDRLPYELFKLERSTSAAIKQFKESKNGVLFAAGALWEGIDIPGDALSMLIIVKLPFQVPDPIGEYEQTLYRDMFEYKSKLVVPEMLIKLKQGFGRLIRTERDTGVVAILDSRASIGGAYRERVLNALPKCRVTNKIGEIIRFMNDKKSPEYFK
jgi:ATP-dependent DNA helicase DinG